MRIKEKIGFLSVCLLLIGQVAKASETSFKYDCININQDFQHIAQLIDQPNYRFSKHVSNKNTADEKNGNQSATFSYQADQDFQQYISYASHLIQRKNPQANRPCPIVSRASKLLAKQNNWTKEPVVSQLIAPFELKPVPDEQGTKHPSRSKPSKGILLIHGLTDSPFVFHDLAAFFGEQGFTVRTLLLPGHGTAAGDLIGISYKQWQKAASYGINRMLKDFDQVYLGGFSTGGALIFDHLMQQKSVDKKIKALMMWSPASKAKSELAWLAKYVDYIPFVDWIDVDADVDFAKYESFPLNAGAQVHALMNKLTDKLNNATSIPDIPLLTIATEEDSTIETKATITLLNKWHNAINRTTKQQDTIFYFGDPTSLTVLPETLTRIFPICDNKLFCENIINVAHTSVTNAPTNPHYGWQGSYRSCETAFGSEHYKACKTSNNAMLGETTSKNLEQHPNLQRLTFNPSFGQMTEAISIFLSTNQ